MTKAYIVTEGQTNADLLKKVLPSELVENVKFVICEESSNAASTAGSMLIRRKSPLALVVDMKTLDKDQIDDRSYFIKSEVRTGSWGQKYEILMAEPELEALFFENQKFVNSFMKEEIGPRELSLAKRNPKFYIQNYMGKDGPLNEQKLLDSLDAETIQAMRNHPLIQRLEAFLSKAIQEAN